MKLLRNGNFLMLCSALLFSTGGMFIKLLPWHALAINGVRCSIAGLMILIYLKATGGRFRFTKGTVIGAICISSTTNLYTFANKLTTAGNAILIQYASPIFLILFMWLIFKEKPRRLDVITCFAVFTGIAFFVMDGLGTGRMLGNALALLSGITYAGVFLMNRIPDGDSFSSAIMGHFTSALIGLPMILNLPEVHRTPQNVCLALAMGLFQMGLGYLCFCVAIKKTAPVPASLISGMEPIMNPLLAALVVGEMISPISAVGGVIVIGSVTIYNVLLARQHTVVEATLQESVLLTEEERSVLEAESEVHIE